MMKIKNTHFKYKSSKSEVLSDINLSFRSKKLYGLIGPNGTGKTTLLSILSGIVKPDSGSVEIYTTPGILIQGISMYEEASGLENLELFCNETNTSKDNIDYVLNLVGIDELQRKLKYKKLFTRF